MNRIEMNSSRKPNIGIPRPPRGIDHDLKPSPTIQKGHKEVVVSGFPRNSVPGLAGEYGDLYSRYLESPWEFWAFCFLTCLGVVVCDSVSLASALPIQTRLFVILLGATARDRKSTPISLTVQFFRDLFPKEFQACEGVGSAEGVARFLGENPKALLVLDEFETIISKGGIKGSVLLPCVSILFEKNSYANYTKASPLRIEGGYLSMLAACTDETFLNMWDSSSLDLGFLNRLFLLPGEATRKNSIPLEIPEQKLISIREGLKSLVDRIEKEKPRFKMTKEAKEVFDRWYADMPNSISTDRLDTYAHRLMVLFAAHEEKERIESELVERVIEVVNWQMKVREQYQPFGAETKLAKLEESIRRQLTKHGSLSKRELEINVHYKRYGVTLFQRALDNLVKAKEVIYDPTRRIYMLL